jgi:hypothetical protein
MTGAGRWRCTDVGKRTIVAIRLDMDHDPFWYSGPPYPVVEHVFDEDAQKGCDHAPRKRNHDESGRRCIKIVKRTKPSLRGRQKIPPT